MHVERDYEAEEGEHADREYLKRCLRLNDHDLNGEFKNFSSDFAYWATKYTEAFRAHGLAKVHRDEVRAQVWLEMRTLHPGGQRGGPTVDDIKAMVDCDKRVLKAEEDLVLVEADKVQARNIVDALLSKREMLRSLGATVRVEMQGDLHMREQSRMQRDFDR